VLSVVDPKTVRAISPLDFTTEVTEEHRGQSIGFS
jgi:hypothetical protein